LLGDAHLTYPSFYILSPEIESFRLYRYLPSRQLTALGITNQIMKRQTFDVGMDYLSRRDDAIYPSLLWMLETGSREDGIDDGYEKVMDITASVLINVYRDQSVLSVVADMVFSRNKKGRYTHDLVWSLFALHDPEAVRLIAQRLRSADKEDVTLARELLNMEQSETASDPEAQYNDYLGWMQENDPYLYFTGDSFQCSSQPMFLRVDLERKYLQKGTASYDWEPIEDLIPEEYKSLRAFLLLDDEAKETLSKYSHRLHDSDIMAWKLWLRSPLGEQIVMAKMGREVFL